MNAAELVFEVLKGVLERRAWAQGAGQLQQPLQGLREAVEGVTRDYWGVYVDLQVGGGVRDSVGGRMLQGVACGEPRVWGARCETAWW